LGQKGNLDGAAGEFSQLLSSSPHWVALGHYHLGLDAIYRRQFQRAHDEFESLRKFGPESSLADRGEAFRLERMGKKDDAIAAWHKYLAGPLRTDSERNIANRAITRLGGDPRVR
jgi:tetratricopeptide (TPR) repeat protein